MSDCIHGGYHTDRPTNCPDCGRFCSDAWDTGWFYTENGGQQRWGGVCKEHGSWEESAA